ncbi:GDP-L-fucose synthase [uncultured Draconibacterium sp.]|uniref:GDP-L-fucose synthase family protein n=1 Tax=uncultured Draconibacterium sp. TaxID=1573823 RepID=UPI0029C686B9|nr:GDP-L-fucose synthase [uncultured Draconibacterium sp.]
MNKNSKIYIAGHKGLVGSAIWKTLKSKGYENLIGKTSENLDLIDAASVKNFFATEQPEYVILAAARVGGISANNNYRAQFIYENLMIQNNVIHYAYLYDVKKLLFLGSTCIYPRETPQPMKEEFLLTSPLEYTNEPYAIAKIAGIKQCESYNLQYGTNFVSVMPTNLYGPNDNFDLEKSHVLPALIRKIHLGKCLEEKNWKAIQYDLNKRPIDGVDGNSDKKEILTVLEKYGIAPTPGSMHGQYSVEIWGTGTPSREFLWSEEMADACIFIMENIDFEDVIPKELKDVFKKNKQKKSQKLSANGFSKTEIRNTHINIGTGKDISISQLANKIKATIGFKGNLYFNKSKPDGTLQKLTDVSKLHALGWQHQIEIDDGIRLLYNWYCGLKEEAVLERFIQH